MMQQQPEHPHLMDAQKNVHVELDMNDVERFPLTRDRVLGLQHELQDALGQDDFQGRLWECEKALGKDTLEFRKRHQQLVLEVQSEIIPKYGFAPSMQGVAEMLGHVKSFSDDKEITDNIQAIDALIWKPHESHHEHEHQAHTGELAHHDADVLHRWEQRQGAAALAPTVAQPSEAFDGRHLGVELDLEAVPVPLSRERILGLQEELREHFAAADFQERLRECELAAAAQLPALRRVVAYSWRISSTVRYGFEGTEQGVHDMIAAIKESCSDDKEVTENVSAIDKLIWRSGHAPDAKAMALKREV